MFLPSTFFFISLLVGLGPQSGRYGGPPGIFGDKRSWACMGLWRVAAVLIMFDSTIKYLTLVWSVFLSTVIEPILLSSE